MRLLFFSFDVFREECLQGLLEGLFGFIVSLIIFSCILIHISERIFGKRFLFQLVFDILLEKRIQNGEAGHADEHTDDAEEARHDRDRRDDPDGRKTRGRPMDAGDDDIAVDLLNDEDHNGEIDRVDRCMHEKNDRAGNGADKGTEDRDDIRDGDHDADQRCVRHTEKLNEQETDKTDEQGVENGTDEIFAEGPIRQRDDVYDLCIELFAENSLCQLFRLRGEMLFRAKKIDGEDETEEDIEDSRCKGLQKSGDLREVFLHDLIGAIHEIVERVDQRFDSFRNKADVLRQGIGKIVKGIQIIGKFQCDILNTDHELRRDHIDEKRDEKEDAEDGKHDGGDAACRAGKRLELAFGTEDLLFKKLDQGIQHIGDKGAVDQGRANIDELGKKAADGLYIQKQKYQKYARAKDDRCIYGKRYVFFILIGFQKGSPFRSDRTSFFNLNTETRRFQ